LYNNNIKIIPQNIFDRLTKLDKLSLSGNNIEIIPPNIFDKLTKLKGLNLYGNNIRIIPPNIFDRLTKLKYLSLYDNNIRIIPPNIFDKLTKLEGLYLYANNIEVIPTNIFDKFTKLAYLYLDGNNISIIPTDSFKHLTKLYVLDLMSNPLVCCQVKEAIAHVRNIRYLLGSCEAPNGRMVQLTQLHTATLNCQVSACPNLCACDPAEKKVDCSRRGLTSIPTGIPDSTKFLDLRANKLTKIDANSFSNLHALEVLNLIENNISLIHPNAFAGLNSLRELVLWKKLFVVNRDASKMRDAGIASAVEKKDAAEIADEIN
jgi:slit protein 2